LARDRGPAPTRRGERASADAGAVTPRRPRPGPPRREAPIVQPASSAAADRQRRDHGGRRLLLALLSLLALAAAIVAVVIITAPAPTRVVLRNVVYSDVQKAASELNRLVSENTK
jgi:hypothetical protein